MSFGDAVRACLRNYVTFSGRARRSEFWFFALFNALVGIGAAILDLTIFGPGHGPLGTLVSLGLVLPTLAVSVRRLHDTGRSGWWLLLWLLPLVGAIVVLVFQLSRGEGGPNRFGPDPRTGIAQGGPERPWQPRPRS